MKHISLLRDPALIIGPGDCEFVLLDALKSLEVTNVDNKVKALGSVTSLWFYSQKEAMTYGAAVECMSKVCAGHLPAIEAQEKYERMICSATQLNEIMNKAEADIKLPDCVVMYNPKSSAAVKINEDVLCSYFASDIDIDKSLLNKVITNSNLLHLTSYEERAGGIYFTKGTQAAITDTALAVGYELGLDMVDKVFFVPKMKAAEVVVGESPSVSMTR